MLRGGREECPKCGSLLSHTLQQMRKEGYTPLVTEKNILGSQSIRNCFRGKATGVETTMRNKLLKSENTQSSALANGFAYPIHTKFCKKGIK